MKDRKNKGHGYRKRTLEKNKKGEKVTFKMGRQQTWHKQAEVMGREKWP